MQFKWKNIKEEKKGGKEKNDARMNILYSGYTRPRCDKVILLERGHLSGSLKKKHKKIPFYICQISTKFAFHGQHFSEKC